MSARALQDFCSHGGIRAFVANDARFDGSDAAALVAADFVRELNRMALRVNMKAFQPREREFDRPAGEPGHERRLRLDRHVLLAAESAAVADKLDMHALALNTEHRGDLPLVVVDALALGIYEQGAGSGEQGARTAWSSLLAPRSSLRAWHRDAGLRF
jgi:hypothetical protein